MRCAVFPLSLVLVALPALAAEQPNRGGGHPANPKPPAQHASPTPKIQRSGQNQAGRAQGNPNNAPNEQFEKLLKMNAEQRDQFLQTLPPQRRQNFERRLNDYQNMAPARRARVLTRLEMLNSLPPQRRQQVRRSMQLFQDLPEDRRNAVGREIQQMAPMPDEQRREHMNSEEFRNRYSVNEQQMMSNLMEVTPPPE
jgi:hypothetical protein